MVAFIAKCGAKRAESPIYYIAQGIAMGTIDDFKQCAL